jgi:pimeloyl-[acyl-carrier protein] methyl ester esterase
MLFMNINLLNYGQGIPVVFFHGWGFDHQVWLPLLPHLSQRYQVILVDLPGFGLTPMMDWPLFKQHLLKQVPQEFAVVGWSLGGLYAQRLAIEEPHRIRTLMSITSAPRFIADNSWPAMSKEAFTTFYNNLSLNVEQTLNDFISLQLNKTQQLLTLGRPPSQAGLEAGLNILDTWDLRHELHGFTKPACFMFGRLDPIMPIKVMEAMQTIYPHFDYIFFRRSAHMPFLSDMDVFIEEFQRVIA